MGNAGQRKFLTGLAALFLALTYFFSGYAFCAGVPVVTSTLANANIHEDDSPFVKYQLLHGADAVRAYSFDNHDADALYETIAKMNDDAKTPYAGATREELMAAPAEYTIDAETLSHLDDVNEVSSRLLYPIIGVAAIACFSLMAGFKMFGLHMVARSLFWSGAIMLGVMAVLGIWAAVAFESLFELFHSMLFAAGTWTFPAESLLITMLPQGFWVGMAFTWAAVSALMAAISLAAGIVLGRRYTVTG